MGHLADKLTQISKEYSALKENYAELHNNQNKHSSENSSQTEKSALEEITSEKKSETDINSSEHKVSLNAITEKYESLLSKSHNESEKVKLENENLHIQIEELKSENLSFSAQCETLTKGLKFMKEEHEKSLEELSKEKSVIEELKQEHDNLLQLKTDCERTILTLNSDLQKSEEENCKLKANIKELNKYTEDIKHQLEETEKCKETVLAEAASLKTNCTVLIEKLESERLEVARLSDENTRLIEDNNSYQMQVESSEEKLSESLAISEENHFLRIQNDDLNNKINDQKDAIASLKSNLDGHVKGNTEIVSKLNDFTSAFHSLESVNSDLLKEKDGFVNEIESLKAQLEKTKSENNDLQNKREETNILIDNLRRELLKYTSVPDTFPHDNIKDLSVVEECQEACIEPVLLISKNLQSLARGSDSKQDKVTQSVGVKTETVSTENNVSHEDLEITIETSECVPNISTNAISESEITERSVSGTNDTAYDSFQQDAASIASNLLSDKKEYASLPLMIEHLQLEVNTIREELKMKSLECEKCHEEIQLLKQSVKCDNFKEVPFPLSEIESDNSLKENASSQKKEVSQVHSASGNVEKEVNLHASSSPSYQTNCVVPLVSCSPRDVVTGDSFVNDFSDFVQKDFQETVSNGKSDGVCSESYHDFAAGIGNVSQLDLRQENKDVSDNAVQADKMFAFVSTNSQSFGVQTDDSSLSSSRPSKSSDNETLEVNSETLALREINRGLEEKIKEFVSTIESSEQTNQMLKNDLVSEKQAYKKLKKDGENTLVALSKLQVDFSDNKQKLEKAHIEIQNLTGELEKVLWERDEMKITTSVLEKDILELKSAKCDIECQKEQFSEELDRVKERLEYLESFENDRVKDRLEYLESSKNDVLEVGDMLDNLQEERENVKRENEKLQCSLSSLVEENEKLKETMDTLHKENSTLLENLKTTNSENTQLKQELKNANSRKRDLENEVECLTKQRNSENLRYSGEIEGLLEENSTLKTSVKIKDSEIECLKLEVKWLNSYFPDIDRATDDINVLITEKTELEKKLQDLSIDNENLVSELLDTQQKLSDSMDECNNLFNKCEEYQNILIDLDNEKTVLLENLDKTENQLTAHMQENRALIEKYEMQLEALDQENSTLKTKVLLLQDENKNRVQTEQEKTQLQEEKSVIESEVICLEQQIQDKEQDLKSISDDVAAKERAAMHLEEQLNLLITENKALKERYGGLEQIVQTFDEKENLMKEQLKLFEDSLKTEKDKSAGIVKMGEQLELERKYKDKIQKDLEKLYVVVDKFEHEKRNLIEEKQTAEKKLSERAKHIVDLQKELEIKSDEVKDCNFRINKMETNSEELRNKLQSSLDENNKLKEHLSESNTTLQFISSNRDHLRAQVEILASEVERLSSCLDGLALQYSDKELVCRKMQYDNDLLNEALSIAKSKTESYRQENKELNNKITALEDQIKVVSSTLKKKAEDQQDQILEIELLRSQLQNASEHSEEFKDKNKQLENETNALTVENENIKCTLEKQINCLKEEFSTAVESAASLQTNNEDLIKQREKANEENTTLRRTVEERNQSISTLKLEYDNVQSDNEMIKMQNEMLLETVQVNRENLFALESKTQKLQSEIKTLKKQNENLTVNKSIDKEGFSNLVAENRVLECKIKEKSEQSRVLVKSLEESEDIWKKVVTENESLKCEIKMLQDLQEKQKEAEESERSWEVEKSENDREIKQLTEKCKVLSETIKTVEDGENILKIENETLKSRIEKLEEQNESLRLTIMTNQESLRIDESVMLENENLASEISRLLKENETIKLEKEELHLCVNTFRDRLKRLDELMELYKNKDSDEVIDGKIKELNRRVAEVQNEKQELLRVTEDLTNTLHDMQIKYEEVKSEMESTKKKCEREISELQCQLKEMAEVVRELRKILEYMETEVHSAAEEKMAYREKLEQKEKEIAKLKMKKDKLETVLNVKKQKDLKNMKMFSENNSETMDRNSAENFSANNFPNCALTRPTSDRNTSSMLSDTEDQNIEPDAVEQLAEAISAMSESLSDLHETYEMFEENEDGTSELEIPSFERAYELLQLRSFDDVSNKAVQTNISLGEFDNSGFLLDDNGDLLENNKDIYMKSVASQADLIYNSNDMSLHSSITESTEHSSRDISQESELELCDTEDLHDSASVSDDTTEDFDHNLENKTYAKEPSKMVPSVENARGQALNAEFRVPEYEEKLLEIKPFEEALEMDDEGIIHAKKDDSVDITEDEVFSAYALQLPSVVSDDTIESLKNTASDLNDTVDSHLPHDHCSLMSTDSGILSAHVVLDDRNLYKFNNHEQNKEQSTDDDSHEGKYLKRQTTETECQTDLDIALEISSRVAEITDQIQCEFNGKVSDLKAEVEKVILKSFEDRETEIKRKEDNYERQIKNAEFEIEEKYEQKSREREIELTLEMERAKKIYTDEVERDARRRIERVKKEKEQQFVEALQQVKADFAQKSEKRTKANSRRVSNVPVDSSKQIGPHGDESSSNTVSQMQFLQIENKVSTRF